MQTTAIIAIVVPFIITAVIVLHAYRKKKIAEEFESVAGEYRTKILPSIVAHTHAKPAQVLDSVESMLARYHRSYDDLGISAHELLGHAVVCARNRVNGLQSDIDTVYEAIDWTRKNPRLDLECFVEAIRLNLGELERARETFNDASHEYMRLSDRWLEANSSTSDSVARFRATATAS